MEMWTISGKGLGNSGLYRINLLNLEDSCLLVSGTAFSEHVIPNILKDHNALICICFQLNKVFVEKSQPVIFKRRHTTVSSYTYLILCFKDRAFWNENCIMTKLMHKFLIDFICLFTSALHVSGFLLAHLQRQAHNFRSGRWHHTQKTWTTAEVICLPLKMG
jgi:hypothetical protein